MAKTATEVKYVICVRNDDCEDLELRKVYRVQPDEAASQAGFLRIVDESGEDYLYPESYFAAVELSSEALAALQKSP